MRVFRYMEQFTVLGRAVVLRILTNCSTFVQLLEHLFRECKQHGEALVAEGIITHKDVEDCKAGKSDRNIISIGLPAYCILQALLRSAKADSDGLLLSKFFFLFIKL